jgi:diguanylate cyclase (GGDEF)-like protein
VGSKERRISPRGSWRTLIRPTNAPAIIAFIVVIIAGIFAESQNRAVYQRDLHARVLNEVSLIRAKLEGDINGNIQLVRGLVAVISAEPDIGQERFAALASNLIIKGSQIRSVAAAPDLVVSFMYPLAGNERAIGLDYNKNDAQRAAAIRARDSGNLVLAGPLDLVQGGEAIIGRFPVFVHDDRDRFWGIVSAVIDVGRLYGDAGLNSPDLPVDIAISGVDALGAKGQTFYGRADIKESNPVVVDVALPMGSWQIAAIPRGGWHASGPNQWPLRIVMFVAGALIFVPIFITGRLIDERQRHIAELRDRERQLGRLSRRLGLALETSRVGVWERDIESGHLLWDDRMNELYGYPADGGPRDYGHWARRLHPADKTRAEEEFRVAVEETGKYLSEYRLVMEDGRDRHIRAIGSIYRDPGQPARLIGVNWDVSADVALNKDLIRAKMQTEARNRDLETAQKRIEYNALHDSLTGLANRRYLDDMLNEHASKFQRGEEVAGLLHIDLDRFKQINDTLGHAAGDAMLVHAAQVLRRNTRPGDFVARVGGDEFVVLCLRPTGDEEGNTRYLASLANRIIDEMQQPVGYEGHECRFGVSIGIASDADSMADPRRLLVNADIALYRAKSRGRNRYQFFNDALQAEITSTKRIADEILSGIERGEFIAHYQPQFDASTLEVVGVEALARWRHPTQGLLPPAAFMKIAEELNVVDTIDRMILEQTLLDLAAWRAAGLPIPKASVNVSARRLRDEELIRGLRGMDIPPDSISFELVESIFLDEADELVAWNVDHIKELGIDIEIDDFGTGYASIVSLLKLKPSRLKIDRQLVLPIVRSPAQRQLVGSIIEIGQSLGIDVLAEGVETMEHARLLHRLGCDALQGYAFARPMSASDLAEFVAARRWAKAS